MYICNEKISGNSGELAHLRLRLRQARAVLAMRLQCGLLGHWAMHWVGQGLPLSRLQTRTGALAHEEKRHSPRKGSAEPPPRSATAGALERCIAYE